MKRKHFCIVGSYSVIFILSSSIICVFTLSRVTEEDHAQWSEAFEGWGWDGINNYSKQTVKCRHLIFWLESQRGVYCHPAKLEPNRPGPLVSEL
jgi:hypothetical protein